MSKPSLESIVRWFFCEKSLSLSGHENELDVVDDTAVRVKQGVTVRRAATSLENAKNAGYTVLLLTSICIDRVERLRIRPHCVEDWLSVNMK